MSGHYITWTIDSFGVSSKVTCHEDADAPCRFGCHECETWSRCNGRDGRWPCPDCATGAAPHCENGHPFRAHDQCTVVEWFEATGPEDLYGGPDDEPIRDGLVEIVWDCDGMTWYYPEPVEQPTLDGAA